MSRSGHIGGQESSLWDNSSPQHTTHCADTVRDEKLITENHHHNIICIHIQSDSIYNVHAYLSVSRSMYETLMFRVWTQDMTVLAARIIHITVVEWNEGNTIFVTWVKMYRHLEYQIIQS